MKYKKIHFAFDRKNNSIAKKLKLLKRYKKYSPRNSDLIVVLGGDGFMLETLNRLKIKNLLENISKSKFVTISALQMVAKTKDNIIKREIAINEISMLRQSKQTASLQIKKGEKIIMKKLVSDGVLISTPAGSTAYNLSVHGPILSLNSKKLAITPISPFRPRRWKGSIISDKAKISINNLDIKKRPVSVVADNVEFRNIKNVKVFINRKIQFNLLYDSKNSLNKKIKIEQVRKEIS